MNSGNTRVFQAFLSHKMDQWADKVTERILLQQATPRQEIKVPKILVTLQPPSLGTIKGPLRPPANKTNAVVPSAFYSETTAYVAVRSSVSGTVLVYRHDDGLECCIPGKCRHQEGVGVYHEI